MVNTKLEADLVTAGYLRVVHVVAGRHGVSLPFPLPPPQVLKRLRSYSKRNALCNNTRSMVMYSKRHIIIARD